MRIGADKCGGGPDDRRNFFAFPIPEPDPFYIGNPDGPFLIFHTPMEFEKFFELCRRMRTVRCSGVFNGYSFSADGDIVANDGSIGASTGPIESEREMLCAYRFPITRPNAVVGVGWSESIEVSSGPEIRFDLSGFITMTQATYKVATKEFFPSTLFEIAYGDVDAGQDQSTSDPTLTSATSSSVSLTIFGESFPMFDLFGTNTGSIVVECVRWWEYRDTNGNNPIWDEDTGEQIIHPLPLDAN